MVERYELGTSNFYFQDLHNMLNCSRMFAEGHVENLLEKNLINSSIQRSPISGSVTVYSLTSNAKKMAMKFGWVTE